MRRALDGPVSVVGAGVFGLTTALALVRRGCEVRLFDGGAGAPSASAVAAGMLAPISEALFDPAAAPHQALLLAARDRWTALEPLSADLAIDRSGVRLAETGALIEDDWRIADVARALQALRALFLDAGGRIVPRRFTAEHRASGEGLVLAPGAEAEGLRRLAPELGRLSPIKGQLAVLHGGPAHGPVVRWSGGYLAPHAAGALVGATMEVGVSDLAIDPAALAALRDGAARAVPQVAGLSFTGRAGVRMSTPDGLPLTGPSATPGVFLAAGARRNGWLLGPLVADMIADYLTGQDPGPWARALHPARFEP